MRRPLKPFVTEYKGSARRPPQPGAAGQPLPPEDHGAQPRENGRFDQGREHAMRDVGQRNEDSYEAAMRAADALFSGARREPEIGDPDVSGPEVNGAPERGRILRVLDEAPLFPERHAEPDEAPKRRGRKPGSKNKPKSPVAVVQQTAPSHLRQAALDAADEDQGDEATYVAPIPAPSPRPVFRPLSFATPEATEDDASRFQWVRRRLGPGEQWKRRRLQKICW